ncbi:MAG: hypothetical protein K5770_04435 [Lachnospiraceae bacterium]|nr:hypothetical protein [Lachnospiraceae bacterium]
MNRKAAGIIMATVMLIMVLLSVFFITAHTDHDCQGEDCPVCACIHQCESLLRGSGNIISDRTALIVPLLLVFSVISLATGFFTENTPVSDKIRMND